MPVHVLSVLLVCLLQAGLSIQHGYTHEQACTMPNKYSQVAENSSVENIVNNSPFFVQGYNTPHVFIDNTCFTFFKINETCFYSVKATTTFFGIIQPSLSIICDLDGYPGTYKSAIVGSSRIRQSYFMGTNNCSDAMNYAFTVEPDCSSKRTLQDSYVILSNAQYVPYNCVWITFRQIVSKLGVLRGYWGLLPLNRRRASCIIRLGDRSAINADRIINSTTITSVIYEGDY